MVAISWVRPSGSVSCSMSTANTRVVHTIAMDLLRQLVEHALQILGQRALELHPPLFGGMCERQLRGAEKWTLEVRDGAQIAGDAAVDAAVQSVAGNWMADLPGGQ